MAGCREGNFLRHGYHLRRHMVGKVLVRERLIITGERWGLLRSLAVLTKGSPVYTDDDARTLPGFTKVRKEAKQTRRCTVILCDVRSYAGIPAEVQA